MGLTWPLTCSTALSSCSVAWNWATAASTPAFTVTPGTCATKSSYMWASPLRRLGCLFSRECTMITPATPQPRLHNLPLGMDTVWQELWGGASTPGHRLHPVTDELSPTAPAPHDSRLHRAVPPREPVLSCRSNTYPKGFYCSWHLPTPTYIPNTFNVTVLHGSKIMVCEKDPALKNRCHIRYMHLFSTIKYKVSISVSNALGHNATAITFDEFTIVKPDPPENVVARPVPSNPRRLEVTWQTPSTWPDPESFPLKFFLRYRPLILDQWQHVELSDGTAHTITDAYAGKEYIIQVAAKDNEIGTWSDWSVAAHATPWTEEPRHLTTEAQAPETTTSTTSSLAPPPTTKICDPGELGSGGGPSAPFLISVPVTVALAAAATTANSLLI
ncbi:ciliary neurotrophic factor receptor subunit alpha isoform X1 [Equus quagga]|uniref:ciliary neurotrophic factor receptor subunit alpha isoform X1 n=1 Tax=Equus quagga TaxID=89248 RepID=UPI001EE3561A|nr:ciliary neurotrophic factor receptor subunit alpha isoform X1 [Equus quagga]